MRHDLVVEAHRDVVLNFGPATRRGTSGLPVPVDLAARLHGVRGTGVQPVMITL